MREIFNGESTAPIQIFLADVPTLEMTGWRVNLAVTSPMRDCNSTDTAAPDRITLQSVVGPTFVNGQPVDHAFGPKINAETIGQSLDTPQLVTEAAPGYGNGAYSVAFTFRLSLPEGTPAGICVPSWVIGLERQPVNIVARQLIAN